MVKEWVLWVECEVLIVFNECLVNEKWMKSVIELLEVFCDDLKDEVKVCEVYINELEK